LGYFHGFEIVVPQYVMGVVDKYVGRAQKRAISEEIGVLRRLAGENKVSILNYNDGFPMPLTREQFESEEDDKILEIAHLTNSVMVTCDGNFKDKALLANRPTIYINPDLLNQVKVIEEVRTP
jgi:predicted PilT family ATPase